MRIMVVENEPLALKNTVDKITGNMQGTEIFSFVSPMEALDFVRNNSERQPVDVGFLDIELPCCNGVSLARQLKKYLPMLSIIFVTGYIEQYLGMNERTPNGYLLKPFDDERLRNQMARLKNPVLEKQMRIHAKTFGQFELCVDGVPVHFSRSKSKELLAWLIDQRDRSYSRRQLSDILFEGTYHKRHAEHLNKMIGSLKKDLEAAEAKELLKTGFNSYSVDTGKFSCDLYEYQKGNPQAMSIFHGIYMENYAWGETTLKTLYEA